MKLCFGDIVVIEGSLIGVVVKSWITYKPAGGKQINYDVYVREFNSIKNYNEQELERYMVRHKYLDAEEMEWQRNAMNGE